MSAAKLVRVVGGRRAGPGSRIEGLRFGEIIGWAQGRPTRLCVQTSLLAAACFGRTILGWVNVT
eukprot:1501963-Prymnesium_polylepis.1